MRFTSLHNRHHKASQSISFFMHCKTVTILLRIRVRDTLWCLSQRIMNLIMSQYWTTLKFSCGYACVKYVICSLIVAFVSCNLNFCCLFFQIPILQNFLFEVFRNYNATPFHNFRHAFCVTQMVRLLASLIRRCMALLLRLIEHLPLGAVLKMTVEKLKAKQLQSRSQVQANRALKQTRRRRMRERHLKM